MDEDQKNILTQRNPLSSETFKLRQNTIWLFLSRSIYTIILLLTTNTRQ
jgi:hypothetical protein